MRLIEEDEVTKLVESVTNEAIEKRQNKATIRKRIIYGLSFLKPVDAKPVKHGQWNFIGKWENTYQCTVCLEEFNVEGNPIDNMMNYCPNCGARMDGVENE